MTNAAQDAETAEELAQAIARIPALAASAAVPMRLGGMTNRVFQIGAHVLRLPGHGTADYIDRANEAKATEAAAAAGVSPALVHVDVARGILVTQFLPGAVTMSPEGFAQRPGSAARAGRVFAQLHGSGATFPARFELFAMIDAYLALLAQKPVALPEGYHAVLAEAEAVRAALAAHPLPLAPCHCDPLCENFLDADDRMWLVDWEYSGMNDPMWDLGDLAVEAALSPAQEEELLAAYFARSPTDFDRGRMVIYKAMCDLLWTLWGLIQLANDNPAEDFRAYADTRFARCKAEMAKPGFARHLAAVMAGPV